MFNNNATAQIKRFVYVDGKATEKSVVWSYEWYLTVVEATKLINPDMYGRAFNFNTEYWADIEQSDTVVIDSKQYSVQTVIKKKWASLSFTRAVLIIDA